MLRSSNGAENTMIKHNTLTRLDGNGVFVSGYTRNTTVSDNGIYI